MSFDHYRCILDRIFSFSKLPEYRRRFHFRKYHTVFVSDKKNMKIKVVECFADLLSFHPYACLRPCGPRRGRAASSRGSARGRGLVVGLERGEKPCRAAHRRRRWWSLACLAGGIAVSDTETEGPEPAGSRGSSSSSMKS